PDISFNAEDGRDVMPHDDDPLVIQVQILNCDVSRVLIDSGSSADIRRTIETIQWDAHRICRGAGGGHGVYHTLYDFWRG
ncbi:hypothetical protein A2U01_0090640, partial [Trifolium medium]|nr:hypothetical protein [Trifolium medium]